VPQNGSVLLYLVCLDTVWSSLNRSAEFTAKPGRCPAHPSPAPSIQCEWDTDCPGWQKCCPSDNLTQCVDPHTHGERFTRGSIPGLEIWTSAKLLYAKFFTNKT
uniref:WAP domain-containing protein n=1 Tax=Electrophorus electricus TaxID=8005 RepID=A0AAY5EYM5_ELEEL